METVYRVWSEWDIGQDEIVFATKELAMDWLKRSHEFSTIEESLDECIGEGLYGIEPIELRTS